MKASLIKNHDISYLNEILLKDGELQILPALIYEEIPHDHLRIFCVKNGIYQLPTVELIEWLRKIINGKKAIEIGSGNGAIGKALSIIATDSFMQERPEIRDLYKAMQQAPVKYGKNVKKYSALKAIKKFKPEIVIASWVTQIYRSDSELGNVYGVDENKLLKDVDMYIHIGNRVPHKKRILTLMHKQYQFPWLFSRGERKKDNVIYVWLKNGVK